MSLPPIIPPAAPVVGKDGALTAEGRKLVQDIARQLAALEARIAALEVS